MLPAFLNFVKKHNLAPSGSRTLITISGGLDSVVLTHLFHQAGLSFSLAHCNFGLRGDESNGDEEFVLKIAENFQVECFVKLFDTKDFSYAHGISTQMAARELRYQWFQELKDEHHFNQIATAHHLNDSFETSLLNFTKGTGIAGLNGISPKNEDIIRPLLFCTREEIETYAKNHHLLWREDSSNSSTKYQRNLLRHKVVPVLKEINPNLENTFANTAMRMSALEEILQQEIENIRTIAVQNTDSATLISISKLLERKGYLVILHELLKPYGFNFEEVKLISENLEGENGKQFISPTHILVKDREQLVITKKLVSRHTDFLIHDGQTSLEQEQLHLLIKERESVDYNINPMPTVGAFDKEKLHFPLLIRRFQHGDEFQPLGMKGKKKNVSDLLNDLKVPRNLKESVWVLCSADKIVWVIGYRMDERFKITEKTKTVLEITI